MIDIIPIPSLKDNYIWIVINIKNNTAFCVDPGESNPVINFIKEKKIQLTSILVTHHHNDHINGIQKLIQYTNVTNIYGPKDIRIPNITNIVYDNQIISLYPCKFKIINTPGHTSTHISYYDQQHNILFCGDSLFSAGCGKIFDGTILDQYISLMKLKVLNKNTKIYCAHEYTKNNLKFAMKIEPKNKKIKNLYNMIKYYNICSLPSTIKIEKQINPFFRTHTKTLQNYIRKKGHYSYDPISIFQYIRKEKDHFA